MLSENILTHMYNEKDIINKKIKSSLNHKDISTCHCVYSDFGRDALFDYINTFFEKESIVDSLLIKLALYRIAMIQTIHSSLNNTKKNLEEEYDLFFNTFRLENFKRVGDKFYDLKTNKEFDIKNIIQPFELKHFELYKNVIYFERDDSLYLKLVVKHYEKPGSQENDNGICIVNDFIFCEKNNTSEEKLISSDKEYTCFFQFAQSFREYINAKNFTELKKLVARGKGTVDTIYGDVIAKAEAAIEQLKKYHIRLITQYHNNIDFLYSDPLYNLYLSKKWEYHTKNSALSPYNEQNYLLKDDSIKLYDEINREFIPEKKSYKKPQLISGLEGVIPFKNVHNAYETLNTLSNTNIPFYFRNYYFNIESDKYHFDFEYLYAIDDFEKKYALYKKRKESLSSLNEFYFYNVKDYALTNEETPNVRSQFQLFKAYDLYLYSSIKYNKLPELKDEYDTYYTLLQSIVKEKRFEMIRLMYLYVYIESFTYDKNDKEKKVLFEKSIFTLYNILIDGLKQLHRDLLLPIKVISILLQMNYQQIQDIIGIKYNEKEYKNTLFQLNIEKDIFQYQSEKRILFTHSKQIATISVPFIITNTGELSPTKKEISIYDFYICLNTWNDFYRYSLFFNTVNRFYLNVKDAIRLFFYNNSYYMLLSNGNLFKCNENNDLFELGNIIFNLSKDNEYLESSKSFYDKENQIYTLLLHTYTQEELDNILIKSYNLKTNESIELFSKLSLKNILKTDIEQHTFTNEQLLKKMIFYKQYKKGSALYRVSNIGFIKEENSKIVYYNIVEVLASNVVEYVTCDDDGNIFIIVPLSNTQTHKNIYEIILSEETFEIKLFLKNVSLNDISCNETQIGVFKKKIIKRSEYLKYLSSINIDSLFTDVTKYAPLSNLFGLLYSDKKCVYIRYTPRNDSLIAIKELQIPVIKYYSFEKEYFYYNKDSGYLYFFGDSEIILYYLKNETFEKISIPLSEKYNVLYLIDVHILKDRNDSTQIKLVYTNDFDENNVIFLTIDNLVKFNFDGKCNKTVKTIDNMKKLKSTTLFTYHPLKK